MNYGYVESSPHRCRPCDKQMMLILAEDDDGGNRHLEHWCECCGYQFPDDVWRIDIAETHRSVAEVLALTAEDAAKILDELGVGARTRMEARLA